MTSYPVRIFNLLTVLPTLLKQTMKPDLIVLNLSVENFKNKEKSIPSQVLKYLNEHLCEIEINWVDKDTKVWKKIIPTLLKYKDDLIIGVDDDFIYPNTMVEEFYKTYESNPDSPISGNKVRLYGLNCHCGCASMVQYKHFQGYIENLDDRVLKDVSSSDLFYTYVANKNGYKYIQTKETYFTNMKSWNPINPYSSHGKNKLTDSWLALQRIYEPKKTNEPRHVIVKVPKSSNSVVMAKQTAKSEYIEKVDAILTQIRKPKPTTNTLKGVVKRKPKVYSKSKFI